VEPSRRHPTLEWYPSCDPAPRQSISGIWCTGHTLLSTPTSYLRPAAPSSAGAAQCSTLASMVRKQSFRALNPCKGLALGVAVGGSRNPGASLGIWLWAGAAVVRGNRRGQVSVQVQRYGRHIVRFTPQEVGRCFRLWMAECCTSICRLVVLAGTAAVANSPCQLFPRQHPTSFPQVTALKIDVRGFQAVWETNSPVCLFLRFCCFDPAHPQCCHP